MTDGTMQMQLVQAPHHLMPALSLAEYTERFNALTQFVQKIMKEGIDYGKVPGTDKNTLLKPGAEKLTTFFGLRAVPTLIEAVQDWTGKEHDGEPFFYYWVRYSLYSGNVLVAEADGSCNSWETKYRYRWAEVQCPTCKNTTIIKGKAEYGGGWLCWAKRGGCGAKFPDGDPAIEQQERGKVPNPNPADIANTILKMAQKRALVAVTLLAVNASEFFTQDMEDLEILDVPFTVVPAPAGDDGKAEPPQKATTPPAPKPAAKKGNGGTWSSRDVTQAMERLLMKVQQSTAHYTHTNHLYAAMKELHGDDFTWGNPNDTGLWDNYAAELVLRVQGEIG